MFMILMKTVSYLKKSLVPISKIFFLNLKNLIMKKEDMKKKGMIIMGKSMITMEKISTMRRSIIKSVKQIMSYLNIVIAMRTDS